jgi:hypothetical protein
MKIKSFIYLALISWGVVSCSSPSLPINREKTKLRLEGTWRLLSGTLIDKTDTTVTAYTQDKSFIKIINGSHFAFMGHDLTKGKDSSVFYSSGGGRYELHDSSYTEHLEYCNAREWEGNDFHFTVTINNDTLVQQGIEKPEGTGIERINIEKYVRLNN